MPDYENGKADKIQTFNTNAINLFKDFTTLDSKLDQYDLPPDKSLLLSNESIFNDLLYILKNNPENIINAFQNITQKRFSAIQLLMIIRDPIEMFTSVYNQKFKSGKYQLMIGRNFYFHKGKSLK